MNKFSFISYMRCVVTFTFVISFMILSSCKDQDHIFREYVVEGGIKYLGAPSQVKVRIGINRLEVNLDIVDAKTEKVGIFWNDYQDTVMVDVFQKKSIRQIINLPEGQYSLFFIAYDKHGNPSNPAELITHTVGVNYKTMITNRPILSKSTSFNDDLTIVWGNSDQRNGERFTNLVYTNIDNEEKVIRIGNEVTTTIINDYKQGTIFKRISYFSPDNQWLDTITVPVIPETSLMIDKTLGGVISFSSEKTSNPAANFYNEDYADTWMTNMNYPEFVTIDLGREVSVSGFDVWPSHEYTGGVADPRAPTTIRFEVSIDNNDWTTVAEIPYDNSLFYFKREYKVPVTNARFVRFTGVECTYAPSFSDAIGGLNVKTMSLAELDVFFNLVDESTPKSP